MSPPYFDLQVNGYAGVDFNDDALSDEALHAACEKLREHGVAGSLATVITAEPARMLERIARLAELRERDPLAGSIVRGIHVEGPFLSDRPGYAGAHPAEWTRDADTELAQRMLDAARGSIRLVTLAPERDLSCALTRMFVDAGVRVAAGHTDASLDQLRAAIDAGLSLFTHAGNGCPVQLPRHDNIVQRALSLSSRLWLCFIADGVHVPWFALGNYLRCAGIERSIIVTDAIAAAGLGPGAYTLAGQTVRVGDDRAPHAADGGEHLVGSAATMPQMARDLRDLVGLSDSEVALCCWHNPRRALGLAASS